MHSVGRNVGRGNSNKINFLMLNDLHVTVGGGGGIRTRVDYNSLNRFRVGAVMAASVPLLWLLK